jgi:bifunctional UDP-N-acetylglucosamine pyrophosphorylase/glucosamine-1-phosphate N-acetyltransferase
MAKMQAIILAAGKGTRMNDLTKPKVMFELCGKPMIYHSIRNLNSSGIADITVVVGYLQQQVREYLGDVVKYAVQDQQLGTGHAVKCGLENIPADTDAILVCYGDMPLYKPDTINHLISLYHQQRPTIAMLSVNFEDPNFWGYGRIIRQEGKIIGSVEQKDCTFEQRQIKESNPCFYIFDARWLKENITKLDNTQNIQKEYYLTDLIDLAYRQNRTILALPVSEETEALGVNTIEQLHKAELYLRSRMKK